MAKVASTHVCFVNRVMTRRSHAMVKSAVTWRLYRIWRQQLHVCMDGWSKFLELKPRRKEAERRYTSYQTQRNYCVFESLFFHRMAQRERRAQQHLTLASLLLMRVISRRNSFEVRSCLTVWRKTCNIKRRLASAHRTISCTHKRIQLGNALARCVEQPRAWNHPPSPAF